MTGPSDFLAQFAGAKILGGCDECVDPYQTMENTSFGFVLTVHHDNDCPRLVRYEGRTGGNRAERRAKGASS